MCLVGGMSDVFEDALAWRGVAWHGMASRMRYELLRRILSKLDLLIVGFASRRQRTTQTTKMTTMRFGTMPYVHMLPHPRSSSMSFSLTLALCFSTIECKEMIVLYDVIALDGYYEFACV